MADLGRALGGDRERAIILVGPLPPPVGGVASYVYRLALLLAENGVECTVLDAYPADGKTGTAGVRHVEFNGPVRWLRVALFIRRVTRSSDCVVHLHFSRVVGRFLLVSLFCVRRRLVFFLTLHNGDQAAGWREATPIQRVAARIALSRISKLIALSHEQLDFYRSIGIPAGRLDRWADAIPIGVSADPGLLPPEVVEIRAVEDGGDPSVLVTSGYPRPTYGYELCLELLDRLSERFDTRLVVCLYGESSTSAYERQLRDRLSTHPRATLVGPMPVEAFLALLARASAYLRPSDEDSYGLAISDALDVGTPCLASDVCARDPRCEIFPTGDRDAFFASAAAIVERGRSFGRLASAIPYQPADARGYLRRYAGNR